MEILLATGAQTAIRTTNTAEEQIAASKLAAAPTLALKDNAALHAQVLMDAHNHKLVAQILADALNEILVLQEFLFPVFLGEAPRLSL